MRRTVCSMPAIVAAIPLQLLAIGIARRLGDEAPGQLDVALLECLDGRRKIGVGRFRQRHQAEQCVRHAAAGGQHHRFARIGRCLDDFSDAAETAGVGDAGTPKFMYDPLVHASHAPVTLRAFLSLPNHIS